VVAVTKTVDPGRIREAVESGIPDLGENYVQEARQKLALFGPDVRWHFVGHLQTNKAKYIPGAFHFVHSVDSVVLARELDRRAGQKEIVQNVLIEVKLDPSATKNGVVPAGLPGLAEAVWRFSNLRLLGLMGMAPIVARPEEARPHFARLRELSEGLPSECRTVLSMGMSADFESAILEGSTMVRIGSAIFGLRRPH
jgi:pyridoxal phosphate enzyme (YggS family)